MNESTNILNKDKTVELEITPFKWNNGVRFTINDTTYKQIEITNKNDVLEIIKALNKVIDNWQ